MDRAKREYLKKLKEVHNSIARCDRDLESRSWLNYWQKDLSSVRDGHAKHQERQLAKKIYVRLFDKKNWRDWLVAVYRDTYGSKKHWRMVCTGAHTWHELNNEKYNILVTSVSSRKSSFASKLRIRFPSCVHVHQVAKYLWHRIPRNIRTCRYPISAVVVDGVPLALQAPGDRLHYQEFSVKKPTLRWDWSRFRYMRHCIPG